MTDANETTPATPATTVPATPATPNPAATGDAGAKLAELETNQRVLLAEIEKLCGAAKPAKEAGLTEQRVQELLTAERTAGEVKSAKAAIVASKLGGVAELAALLPDTTDATVLATAADALAARLNPALAAANKSITVGNPARESPLPPATVDPEKMSNKEFAARYLPKVAA
jgi:hypothetical protein